MTRVALITGGAQGLGFATAQHFLQQGFSGVVLVDRNEARLNAAKRSLAGVGKVAALAADLTDDGTAATACALAQTTFGRLDVLVNAAGNTERCGLEDTTPEAFHRVFNVNVKAPFQMMQAAAPLMKRQGQGVMINIGSMLAHGGPAMLATYSASKAALQTLTKNAANTWKREGIRCFVINLGWANTDGEHQLQTKFHNMPENWADDVGRRMPFGRLISSEDVAGMCLFLTTPPALMMTGAVIDYEQMPMGVYDIHPPSGLG